MLLDSDAGLAHVRAQTSVIDAFEARFAKSKERRAAYAELLRRSDVDVTYKCYDSLAHGFTAFTGVVDAARRACEEIASMVAAAYGKFEIEDD